MAPQWPRDVPQSVTKRRVQLGGKKPWPYSRIRVPPQAVESARNGLLTLVSQVRILPGPRPRLQAAGPFHAFSPGGSDARNGPGIPHPSPHRSVVTLVTARRQPFMEVRNSSAWGRRETD